MNAQRFATVADFATPRNSCLYFGEHGDWYMVAGQHRESDSLTRSNFTVLVERLEKVDPKGEGFTVERFSCSLVGWRDHLLVALTARQCLRVAVAAARALESYPVLDEDHWSNLELEEASEWWEQESDSFRLECCRECGVDLAAADCDCLGDALEFDRNGRLYEYLTCC
jgi:hypothetical protein